MTLKDCLPLCLAMAASLSGCGSSDPGPAGPAGPMGEPGPVDPKLTALTPSGAFLSRSLELQISGSGTHFKSDSVVDFGDAQVTATQTTAGSDNNLRIMVQVGSGARLGAHDVTVTSGTESAILKGAFTVQSALQAEPATQPISGQGSLYAFNLRNLDYHENPFNPPAPIISGFSVVSMSNRPERLAGVAIIDALTPPGLLSVTAVAQSPFGADVAYSTAPTDSSLAMVVTRTPSPLTNNTARAGQSLPTQNASNFYKLTTAAAGQLLVVSYSAIGSALTTGSPKLVTAVAPASGKFSQGFRSPWSYDMTAQRGLMIAELATAGDYYLTTFSEDFSGAATGYTYTITPKVSTLSTMNNPEPTTETPANPSLKINSLSGAVAAGDGKASTSTDSDYLVFTAATTGTALLQVTNSLVSDYPYPLSVELYSDAACTTIIGSAEYASPGKSVLVQTPLTAGMTYCVKIFIPIPAQVEIPYKILLAP